MQYRFAVLLAAAAALSACVSSPPPNGNTPPSAAQGVYFIEPADGSTVSSPVKVKFGLKGMTVKPAGEIVAGTGHHHLLIDAASPKQGDVIPADEKHLHFGKGQTETELKLPPGNHVLTMQFADGLHQSYGDAMSASVRITVQ
ncbi:DUF4399 domain-containing protein [Methylibium sp.]|uniref:DUF4399 domain-containing protein n=1 Tax=Methylibium sp. TaxID=2067992 RepID=UPI003D09C4A1